MMKLTKYLVPILAIILLLGVVYFSFLRNKSEKTQLSSTGSQEKSSANDSDFLVIRDQTGREVKVNSPVKRIAFNHFSTGEALKLVDAWDKVVGICRCLDPAIFPDLEKIPLITGQSVYDLNYEKIFESKPDVFISVKYAMSGFDEMIAKLEPQIPVVIMNFREPAAFEENLKTLGLLLGKEKEAERYLEWYRETMAKIESSRPSPAESQPPLVFFKTSWGEPDDIQTLTDISPGISERNRMTGCKNVAGELPSTGGWVQAVNTEWLATQPIDIIVVLDIVQNGYGLDVSSPDIVRRHREQIMALPAFSSSQAVKDNRVYMLTGEFFGTPRYIVGFAYMVKWFYPQHSNINPASIHQDYLNRFLGANVDLNKGGIFAYPEQTTPE